MNNQKLNRFEGYTEGEHPPVRIRTVFPLETESITDQTHIVVVNGWGEGRNLLSGVARILAKEGRVATVFDHHRRIPKGTDPLQHKVETLRAVMEHVGSESYPVDLMAHSEGAITALKAAEKVPEQVRALSLIAPAGLSGALPGAELVWRLAREALSQPSASLMLGRAAMNATKYALKNPRLALREIAAIGDTNVVAHLGRVSVRGIPLVLLLCEQDALFPLAAIQENIDQSCRDTMPIIRTINAQHIGLFARENVISTAHEALQEAVELVAPERVFELL